VYSLLGRMNLEAFKATSAAVPSWIYTTTPFQVDYRLSITLL